MRIFLLGVGAPAIVLVFFFGTLFVTNYYVPLCPAGESVDLAAPYQRVGNGFAYIAAAPALEDRSDSSANPTRSKFLVCENEFALGPAHSLHAEVGTKGKGRFSHWTAAGFIFSASDNSNPNNNGKHYRAVVGP